MESSGSTSPVVERTPPLARLNSSPIASPLFEDPEAQQDRRFERRWMRRESTLSSFGLSITELKTLTERRNTVSSTLSSAPSDVDPPPPLQRTETLVVDDEAAHGYPKLATMLGGVEGYAIYRRFASLNARNLLYHQAKLTHLEHQLNLLEKSLEEDQDVHYSVDHIFSAQANTPRDRLRRMHEEVSRALDKYNGLLIDQNKLYKLASPDHTFVDSIYNFINNTKLPKPGWLGHPESTVYQVYDDRKPVQSDLITLNPEFRTQDAFTRFFTHKCVKSWHNLRKHFKAPDDELGGYVYREKTMSKWMRAIVMIVASALPTCSIVALYFINSSIWRLVFVILFGGIFSAALTFFTDGKRIEIFTASVALAGVQVVFVGTFGNNGAANT